jgi:hypothetical protein
VFRTLTAELLESAQPKSPFAFFQGAVSTFIEEEWPFLALILRFSGQPLEVLRANNEICFFFRDHSL